MSLSPIFSMMRDFLVVVRETGSELDGPRLRDMCKDLGDTFLLSPAERFLLLGKDEPFPIFVEDLDEDRVDVGVGFDTLGVERCGDLAILDALVIGEDFAAGDAGFFFILEMFFSLFTGAI